MPTLIAGKIDCKHLIPNMTGKVFVIGISSDLISHIGFIFFIIKSIAAYFILKYLFERYILTFLSSIWVDNEKQIDVVARPIALTKSKKSSSGSRTTKKTATMSLKQYANK